MLTNPKITVIQIDSKLEVTKRVRQIATIFGPEAYSYYMRAPISMLTTDLKQIAQKNKCIIKSWIDDNNRGIAEVILPDKSEEVTIISDTENKAIVFIFKWLSDRQLLKKEQS